jgi:hypothetical protein
MGLGYVLDPAGQCRVNNIANNVRFVEAIQLTNLANEFAPNFIVQEKAKRKKAVDRIILLRRQAAGKKLTEKGGQ